jgi:phage terminase large subunit GpA-like protein
MGLFTTKEAAAFMPPEKLLPSQWAERYRYLTPDIAENPGPYSLALTPYIRGMMDAITDPYIREIVFVKAAQVGYSTLIQNLIGWMVEQAPAPAMFVLPRETDTEKLKKEQLTPLIESCPQLKSHLSGRNAITKAGIRFDSMPLYWGYATSPITLASRYLRYGLIDETDKCPPTSGQEGDFISLTRRRLTTAQERGRLIIGCTPTTTDNHIWKQWLGCGDRRYYYVPCPQCNEYQRLIFAQLRFDFEDVKAIEDKSKQADFIESYGRSYYECEHCKALIPTHQKQLMLSRGQWLSEGQRIDRLGQITGQQSRAQRVGFHISALYSPFVSWPKLAAEFRRAEGDRGRMREFVNQNLGEPFHEVGQQVTVAGLREQLLEQRALACQPGVVPRWAGCCIAAADVQANRCYFTVRAWGRDRSQLVHFGECHTFADLKRLTLESDYPIDGRPGEFLKPARLFIDSGGTGDRTAEIYEFASSDPRILAVKGAPSYQPSQLFALSTPSKELGINLGIIDTQYFKDQLVSLRKAGKWLLHENVSDEFLRHLSAEAKIRDPKTGRYVWKAISANNHYLDACIYDLAAAHYLQTGLLPDEATIELSRNQQKAERDKALAAVPKQPGLFTPQPTQWQNKGSGTKWL